MRNSINTEEDQGKMLLKKNGKYLKTQFLCGKMSTMEIPLNSVVKESI